MKVNDRYIIGGEWLYYKIYTGPKTSDFVLTEIISPLMKEQLHSKFIDKWFFIRYADPKNHLRIRMHLTKSDNLLPIVKKLRENLQDLYYDDLIWDIKIDSYSREIKRYGANTIDFTESLFYFDSELITNFLCLIDEGTEGEELKWLFALKCIDSLLNSFNFLPDQKYRLLALLNESFGNEFNMSRSLKKQLDKKYRFERVNIEQFISKNKYKGLIYPELMDLISSKEKNIKNIVDEIMQLKIEDKLEVDFNNYLSSIIHMTMNRVFRSKNRLVEMVCYNFLSRYYRSEIAKNDC